jgi:hypothetical protein
MQPGARVLVVCDTLFIHLDIERVFGRQLGAIKFLERAEPFIKEYSLREQQFVRSEAQSTDKFSRAMVVMPDFVIIFRECFATVETRRRLIASFPLFSGQRRHLVAVFQNGRNFPLLVGEMVMKCVHAIAAGIEYRLRHEFGIDRHRVSA